MKSFSPVPTSSRLRQPLAMAFVSVFTPPTSLRPCATRATPWVTTARRMRTSTPCARPAVIAPCMEADNASSPSPTTAEAPDSSDVGNISVLPYEDGNEQLEVTLDDNVSGFCSVDPNTGKRLELSLREKENIFLDAMQAFFNGESLLSNDEFDALKEELTWQGSDVVTLSRDEFRFLDAAKAYEQGRTTMPDDEFDKLKKSLFEQGSVVAIQRGPRCSIERQITFSDVIPDKNRTLALFLPAGLFIALAWLSFAFEFTPLHRLDPVLSLIIGSPFIILASRIITGLVVPRCEIMVGDCPSCGRRTHVLFGNVLNQKGFESEASVKCEKCKAKLKVEKETSRMILMEQGI